MMPVRTTSEQRKARIGEENIADALNDNIILTAFFEKDLLVILHCFRIYHLKWVEDVDGNYQVRLAGETFHLIALKISDTNDYYKFVLHNVTRIIPRLSLVKYATSHGAFVAPENWNTFGWYLKHSRYISCLKDFAKQYRKTYPELFKLEPLVPDSIIVQLRKFRNWATERGVTPMIFSGTLLGYLLLALLFYLKQKTYACGKMSKEICLLRKTAIMQESLRCKWFTHYADNMI
ncbi:unnamed protein product [Gongylonema pulchrum]|uniref:Uncharacterized protein n=1 Tax=Gongylonema pulchrum TaxID=637853 RepID=A0A183EBH9_9BILA|nr:unnamed protein product [Gongylonema pulchrum]